MIAAGLDTKQARAVDALGRCPATARRERTVAARWAISLKALLDPTDPVDAPLLARLDTWLEGDAI